MTQEALRFAALIRVSTEKQERQGESLRTQEKQIKRAVKSLGGSVTATYAGQEHATSGWERLQLERLLSDAAKKSKTFDAVIVADPSRWSRDNVSSEIGLETLRDNGIRFFVLSAEHDLNNDDARLFLALTSTINAYQARVQVRKSLENRIELARKGVPAVGVLPYGRHYDKKTGEWSIDEEKQRELQEIVARYIADESIVSLALEYGMTESTLRHRLTQSGDLWTQEFHSDKLKIHESIPTKIPELLDAETRKAIRKQAEANKTTKHGHIKYKSLLSRMIFCEHCGSALSAQPYGKRRCYRHMDKRKQKCPDCPFEGYVDADDIESIVMRTLFFNLSSEAAVRRAIDKATPNKDEQRQKRKQLARLNGELSKVIKGRERVVQFIAQDKLTDEQAAMQLDGLNDKELQLNDAITRLQVELENAPSPEEIDVFVKQFTETAETYRIRSAAAYAKGRQSSDDLTWEDKRALLQYVFEGRALADGRRNGVYVATNRKMHEGTPYRTFEIVGKLTQNGFFPWDAEFLDAAFGAADGSFDESDLIPNDFDYLNDSTSNKRRKKVKKPSVVSRLDRCSPILPQRYSHPCRTARRAGG